MTDTSASPERGDYVRRGRFRIYCAGAKRSDSAPTHEKRWLMRALVYQSESSGAFYFKFFDMQGVAGTVLIHARPSAAAEAKELASGWRHVPRSEVRATGKPPFETRKDIYLDANGHRVGADTAELTESKWRIECPECGLRLDARERPVVEAMGKLWLHARAGRHISDSENPEFRSLEAALVALGVVLGAFR